MGKINIFTICKENDIKIFLPSYALYGDEAFGSFDCQYLLLGNNKNNLVLFFNCRQTLRASSCSVLEDIKEKAQDYSVIGIDEGQFVSVNNLSYSREDIHC